ncbi:MAG: radical SAM protein [Defluviitaleaceae bacterium]|nr:radical SAM protein [Defluviitaleaceae bacterium]
MKLINHIIFVDLEDENKLLVNSLNGNIAEINQETYTMLLKWQQCGEILPQNDLETELFNYLMTEGFLAKDEQEEINRKNEILDVLRKSNEEDRKHCRKITFIMTYDCNFSCAYCFEGKARLKNAVIQPEQIDAALKLSNDNPEYIGLFGGEPFLPKTRKSIEYLFEKMPDKIYDIISNGYYLEEYADLLAKVQVFQIMVTLDGDEATHDKRRHLVNGQPTYQKIIKGIEKCLENKIPILIRMNVDDSNINGGFELQEQLFERFSKHKEFLQVQISPLFQISDEEKNKMMSDIHKEDIEHVHRGNKVLENIPISNNPVIKAIAQKVPMIPLYSFCYAHQNQLFVDPYGKIFSCATTVGKDELATGQYQPTVDIKENSVYNRNIDTIPECRECIYSLICGGGCANRLRAKDDYFKPECSIVMTQMHDLLPKYYKLMQQEGVEQ